MMRCLVLCILVPLLLRAAARPTLNAEERTNGEQVLKEVTPMLPEARASCARVLDGKGETLAAATWVGADGYFLTKASETPEIEKGRICWANAKSAAIRGRDACHFALWIAIDGFHYAFGEQVNQAGCGGA